MSTFSTNDVHRQFAEFFPEPAIRPFAFLLSTGLMEGHICIDPAEALQQESFPTSVIPDWNGLSTWVGTPLEIQKPFILSQSGKLYLQRYFVYESNIVAHLKSRFEHSKNRFTERKDLLFSQVHFIQSLNATLPTLGPDVIGTQDAVDWQLIGALRCLLTDFSILTGGPGTGKTTTLAKLLKIYHHVFPEGRVRLGAPTGKAATRMTESLRQSVSSDSEEFRNWIARLESSTLHALLGYQNQSVKFKYQQNNPLPFDLVVIDEASMIDLPMMSKLLDALDTKTQLIILGDRNQLSSVEAGSLLGDLCRSAGVLNQFIEDDRKWLNQFISDPLRAIPESNRAEHYSGIISNAITELHYSHRFSGHGGIGKTARAILSANMEEIEQLIQSTSNLETPDVQFDSSSDRDLLKKFVSRFEEFILEQDIRKALQKFNRYRILTTVREGKNGLDAINIFAQGLLEEKGLIDTAQVFYENRPVLITRNNYELGLMNGDVGILRADENGVLRAWFDEGILDAEGKPKLKSVLPAYLSHVETTFAMTIHKSQGSEYEQVMVVLPEDEKHPLLTRELLYTAITRARKHVVVHGAHNAVIRCIQEEVLRKSGINEQLNRN